MMENATAAAGAMCVIDWNRTGTNPTALGLSCGVEPTAVAMPFPTLGARRRENSTGNVLRAIAAGQGPAGRPVIPGDAAPAHQDPPVARPAAGPVAAPRVLELKSREYVSRLERSRRPNRAKVL